MPHLYHGSSSLGTQLQLFEVRWKRFIAFRIKNCWSNDQVRVWGAMLVPLSPTFWLTFSSGSMFRLRRSILSILSPYCFVSGNRYPDLRVAVSSKTTARSATVWSSSFSWFKTKQTIGHQLTWQKWMHVKQSPGFIWVVDMKLTDWQQEVPQGLVCVQVPEPSNLVQRSYAQGIPVPVEWD